MNSLVTYSGSSSEDEVDETDKPASVKRSHAQDNSVQETEAPASKRKREDDDQEDEPENHCNSKRSNSSLPLPSAILGMFGDSDKQANRATDDPSQHGGRLRSFPHVEGNWASYVSIPVSPDERLNSLIEQLLLCLRPLTFDRMDDLHVSLSRTVAIRHHWIQPLTEALKDKFQHLECCLCDVGPLKIYTNDEKTRTFLSVEIKVEDSELLEYTSAVDACFAEFNLPGFYEKPSFHVSLVWCVGDVMSHITDKTKDKLQKLASEFFIEHTDLSVVPVKQILLKTGNKTFAFHLQGGVDE